MASLIRPQWAWSWPYHPISLGLRWFSAYVWRIPTVWWTDCGQRTPTHPPSGCWQCVCVNYTVHSVLMSICRQCAHHHPVVVDSVCVLTIQFTVYTCPYVYSVPTTINDCWVCVFVNCTVHSVHMSICVYSVHMSICVISVHMSICVYSVHMSICVYSVPMWCLYWVWVCNRVGLSHVLHTYEGRCI